MSKKKTNKLFGKDLYAHEIEQRVNEFVSNTFVMVDKIIEKCMNCVDSKLERKLEKLEMKLSQMNKVVDNDEEEE